MKKAILSLAVLAAFSTTAADSFQQEVSLGYRDHTEISSDGIWDLGYRYYLDAQSNDKDPYELIPFLSHASWLNGGFTTSDFGEGYSIGGRFVTDSDWVFSGGYAVIDPDHGSSDDFYSLGLGKYIAEGTLVSFDFNDSDTSKHYALGLTHLLPVAGSEGLLINAGITNSDSDFIDDDIWSYSLGGDYYFARHFSVGAGVSWNDGSKDFAWGLNSSYWFNSQANLSLSVTDSEDQDGFGWNLTGSYRF
ncbi:putative porin [Gallaecimonas sp. GXIMD4217]|uniref:putative porin n=1 Tax=Gallaecimonas sp. GXIMD4217 TaxID=3131927 RepID=UPI00311AF8C5